MNSPNATDAAAERRRRTMIRIGGVCIVVSCVLLIRSSQNRPSVEFDAARTLRVRCAVCGGGFEMGYGAYKQAVESRRDLDGGIRCVRCGAENGVWRELNDDANSGPGSAPPPESLPSTSEPAEPARSRPVEPIG